MAIVETRRNGAVATVMLNRPERMNALTVEMREGIAGAFTEFGAADDIRAIILTAAGPAFCASGDVSKMGAFTPASAKKHIKTAHRMVLAVANVEKPVVAAVRGAVAGIGWSLALASDVVVASRTAKFSQVFKKVGVVPDGGAIYFLTQSLGVLRAKDLVYSARTVSAQEAFELGLVTRLVDDDALESEAEKIAEELAAGPTFAFGNAKKLFKAMYQPSLETFLDTEAWAQSLTVLSDDHKEGAAAFLQKRKAVFKGS
jgi:2-(1,2-epoxy-1,2-dihydrophenyl)acetyl-CoA isomerase